MRWRLRQQRQWQAAAAERRRRLNVTMTSFPDYVDPQLSYTVEGWEVAVQRLHPAAHLQARQGRGRAPRSSPAWPRPCPRSRPTARPTSSSCGPNMKYSDGTPIKASDFTYAIQRLFKANSGGSVFYEPIVGANGLRRRQGRHDQRHHHRRRHRRHHHHADRGQRHLRRACSACRSPRPSRRPRRSTRTRRTIRRRPAGRS